MKRGLVTLQISPQKLADTIVDSSDG